MTYEEVLEKAVAEGAIRAFRLSDNTAYAYRLKDGKYQARSLVAREGNWALGPVLVSGKAVGRTADGWYEVVGLPHRAQPIGGEAAEHNAGYSDVSLRQCYSCKQFKPQAEFAREGGDAHRNWECNECYERRTRELAMLAPSRRGDFLDKDTLVSPPPPQGKI
ncbi:MAG: hypothetical protein KF701_04555 [Anaerolineales bacterium]|nr:MAG: hypothetical protein KF701_04555 [Anaerolineales bacterium]